jgi:hypothetical protein
MFRVEIEKRLQPSKLFQLNNGVDTVQQAGVEINYGRRIASQQALRDLTLKLKQYYVVICRQETKKAYQGTPFERGARGSGSDRHPRGSLEQQRRVGSRELFRIRQHLAEGARSRQAGHDTQHMAGDAVEL